MGQIANKLIKRLSRSRKLANEIRREADSIQVALDSLKRGPTGGPSHWDDLDPLHAVHVAVQNVTSVFAERVSQLAEFDSYWSFAKSA